MLYHRYTSHDHNIETNNYSLKDTEYEHFIDLRNENVIDLRNVNETKTTLKKKKSKIKKKSTVFVRATISSTYTDIIIRYFY